METKIVITDDILTLKNFECSNCDYKINDEDLAIAHQKEFKHEFWQKRGYKTPN